MICNARQCNVIHGNAEVRQGNTEAQGKARLSRESHTWSGVCLHLLVGGTWAVVVALGFINMFNWYVSPNFSILLSYCVTTGNWKLETIQYKWNFGANQLGNHGMLTMDYYTMLGMQMLQMYLLHNVEYEAIRCYTVSGSRRPGM